LRSIDDVDPVAVLRIWQRDPPARIRRNDRAAFIVEAIAKGLNDKEIADYLGVQPNSIYQWRHRQQNRKSL
jgi:transposase-like protein